MSSVLSSGSTIARPVEMSGPPDNLQPADALHRLRRKTRCYLRAAAAAELVNCTVRFSIPGLVIALTAVFLGKLLWPPLVFAVWLAPAWLVAAAGCVALRRERWLVPQWRAAALTDLRSRNHGLFMTLDEADGPDWAGSVAGADAPVPARKPVAALAAVALFAAALAAATLLPDLRPRPLRHNAPGPVKDVATLTDALAASGLVDEAYAKQVHELVRRLESPQGDGMNSEDWHALDRCKEELKQRASESLRNLEETRKDAGDLADKVREGQGLTEPQLSRLNDILKNVNPENVKQSAEQRRALEQLSKEQRENAERLASELSPDKLRDLLAQCQNGEGGLSKADRQLLAALLEEIKAEAGKGEKAGILALGQEGDGGGMPGDLAGIPGGEGEAGAGLDGMLDGNGGSTPDSGGGLPGKGGIDRGPGSAPVQHLEKTSEKLGEFKAQTFKANAGEPIVDLGHNISPPDPTDTRPPTADSGGPIRTFRAGDERLTWTSRLLPRHNDALKQYFETRDDGGKK